MSRDDLDRRTFLGVAGAATVTALAGCTGTSSPPTPTEQAGGSADDAAATTPTEAHEGGHHEAEGHGESEAHHEAETDDDHHEAETDDDHHEAAEHHEDSTPHGEGGHSAGGPVTHAEVVMQSTESGEHFHPHVAWVEPGGTVTFHNESGAHTATAYHPDNDRPLRIPEGAESFDSGLLSEQGATFEHAFEVEGVYDIYCAPHEQLGMIGTVVVGTPDPHDQPGLAEPQGELSERVASKIEQLNEQVDTMLGHEH